MQRRGKSTDIPLRVERATKARHREAQGSEADRAGELHHAEGRATPPPWCEFVRLGNKQVTPLS